MKAKTRLKSFRIPAAYYREVIRNTKSYLGADIVSVAVDFFAFFLCAFLVAFVAVSFWAKRTAEPDRSERLMTAMMIFFI